MWGYSPDFGAKINNTSPFIEQHDQDIPAVEPIQNKIRDMVK